MAWLHHQKNKCMNEEKHYATMSSTYVCKRVRNGKHFIKTHCSFCWRLINAWLLFSLSPWIFDMQWETSYRAIFRLASLCLGVGPKQCQKRFLQSFNSWGLLSLVLLKWVCFSMMTIRDFSRKYRLGLIFLLVHLVNKDWQMTKRLFYEYPLLLGKVLKQHLWDTIWTLYKAPRQFSLNLDFLGFFYKKIRNLPFPIQMLRTDSETFNGKLRVFFILLPLAIPASLLKTCHG